MNKPTIVLLLILIVLGCNKNVERTNIANELRGNTFKMSSVGENDTLTIEFKDSTYKVFEYSARELPWRIATFYNNNILVIENRIIAIKQTDDNSFEGLFISEKDYEIKIEKRRAKWSRELLNGIWIEEQHHALFFNDSTEKPPLPPAPPGVSIENFQYPPLYEIDEDTILTNYFYQESKSKIDVNNTAEFIRMNLRSEFNKVEKQWKVKKLTDSIMIIDRTLERENEKFNFLKTNEENIKLIKIIR
ncbi:MAG: hypothetical protein ABJJ05_15875 [Maribacter litoralis]|uniref:hypothetical protein n=1 Tax=Maribacter litoralis TaxID=2059726 RepID=UPI00329813E8